MFEGFDRRRVEDFDPAQLRDYRRCWRSPEMIHGSCSDYRAAATIDFEHDEQDMGKKVECPTLVFFGNKGTISECFDIPAS